MHDYDVIVIGTGFTGLTAAGDLASLGRSVAVIDRRQVVDRGCRTFAALPRTMEILWQRGLPGHVFDHDDRTTASSEAHGAMSGGVEVLFPYGTTARHLVDTALGNYARECGAQVIDDYEATGVDLDHDGAHVEVERCGGGEHQQLDAEYVVSADGTSDMVRDLLGYPYPGHHSSFVVSAGEPGADTLSPSVDAPAGALDAGSDPHASHYGVGGRDRFRQRGGHAILVRPDGQISWSGFDVGDLVTDISGRWVPPTDRQARSRPCAFLAY